MNKPHNISCTHVVDFAAREGEREREKRTSENYLILELYSLQFREIM